MSLLRNVCFGVSRHFRLKVIPPKGRIPALPDRSCLHQTCILDAAGIEVKMPSLSPTMTEGTIVKWLKNEGDPVQPGDILCEIQTDKAVVALETEEEGVLAKILMKEDSKDVKVGTLIALMVEEGEDWKSVEVPAAATETPQPAATSSAPTTTSAAPPSSAATPASSTAIGPATHFLLEKYKLDSSTIPATGPKHNLLKGDILKYVEQKGLQPAVITSELPAQPAKSAAAPQAKAAAPPPVAAEYEDLEVSNMRRTIAKRLTQSKSMIPHSYGTIDCHIDSLIKTRKKMKADGVTVSVNDFIIKAVAVALQACPRMNVIWQADQVVLCDNVDISVAVATDSGLITPIINDVAAKGLVGISAAMKDLALRARENKLKLHEFQGGTFTISNLGMFGISEFSAIINPPQCGILAVGSGRSSIDEHGKPSTKMTATLSFDANAVSEDTAAQFLETLKDVLEDPALLLLGVGKQRERASIVL